MNVLQQELFTFGLIALRLYNLKLERLRRVRDQEFVKSFNCAAMITQTLNILHTAQIDLCHDKFVHG